MKWILKIGIGIVVYLISLSGMAQPGREEIWQHSKQVYRPALDKLREFLALPNDAYIPQDLEPNIQWLIREFTRLQFRLTRIPTGGLDLLLAERPAAGATKTLLVYLQVDGQPVDPAAWNQAHPFIPGLKRRTDTGWQIIPWESLDGEIDPEWRIFCRSASDAKGPIIAFLAALQIMEKNGWYPNYHLKVIMDSEEELGSPNLAAAVENHRDLLKADMMVIYDGPRHVSNKPTLTFGARGIATMRITTYGPRVPQHSGHYGNYAPNPALTLSQLLASMKDEYGRVTIPGFYDGILIDEATKRILKAVPDDEEMIQESLGIASPDSVASTYQESLQYPSLNIRGMSSAWVGTKVRTIIPDAAVVNLDIRLVKESDPKKLIDLVTKHIQGQGFHICNGEPTEEERRNYRKLCSMAYEISYEAFRTDFDEYVALWLDKALTSLYGESPVKIRTAGGSIPISPFVKTLGIPAVSVPIVHPENNQHSPNENLRLGNFLEGIATYLAILMEKVD